MLKAASKLLEARRDAPSQTSREPTLLTPPTWTSASPNCLDNAFGFKPPSLWYFLWELKEQNKGHLGLNVCLFFFFGEWPEV